MKLFSVINNFNHSKDKTVIRHSLVLLCICVLGLTMVLIGSSYALLTSVTSQTDINSVDVGTLRISYDDTSTGMGDMINLTSAYPVSDEEGMNGKGYTFKITNTGTLAVDYKVQIINDDGIIKSDGCSEKLLSLDNIRFSVNGGTPLTLGDLETTNYTVSTGSLQTGDSETYVIRMWIKEDSGNEIIGTHYHGKVVVEGIQGKFVYKDKSGANPPELVDGMIPVRYDGNKWVKATTFSEWYDYDNQEWANAVTVTEGTREQYMRAEAGTEILMDDINTMWVWIPRYEYQFTNLAGQYAGGTQQQPGEIKVNFLRSTTTQPSNSSNYKVHPAFTFGEKELTGIWYAKFETTGTLTTSCIDTNCDTSQVTIKPGLTSLRNQSISSFFYLARSMQLNNGNTFGFSSDSGDVHMSKNSEWGAVAYLSQSKYGKYGNPNYEGVDKEIYQNKSDEYITGSSNGTPSISNIFEQTNYDTPDIGYGASTTGTIYGVYDMSGGAWEYVMGNYNNIIKDSGFSEMPESKYYDLYTTTNEITACNGEICYGHALSETSGWYDDNVYFINNSNFPWLNRSGSFNNNIIAGIYGFFNIGGSASSTYASRLTIAP